VEAPQRLRAGRDDVSEILGDLLAAMKRRDRLSAIGWSMEADDVVSLVLPSPLLKPSTFALLVVAVPGRRPVEALLAMVA
jgi:hypothetical protein